MYCKEQSTKSNETKLICVIKKSSLIQRGIMSKQLKSIHYIAEVRRWTIIRLVEDLLMGVRSDEYKHNQ